MGKKPDAGYIYIMHFTEKLHHAQHYIGFSRAPLTRIAKHRQNCSGTKIIEACHERGIGLVEGNIIPVPHYSFERRLKRYKKAQVFCKYCNPEGYSKATLNFIEREVKRHEEKVSNKG